MIALLQTCSSAPVLQSTPALKKEHHYLTPHPKLKSATNSLPTAKIARQAVRVLTEVGSGSGGDCSSRSNIHSFDFPACGS